MKLVVGLGNPESRYENTRHNVGFIVVDRLADEMVFDDWKHSKNANALYTSKKVNEVKVELIKPQTFMNDSGISAKYARDKHKIDSEDIFVVFDDLDIPLGEYKIQKGKGPKDHNGLNSVYEKLGTKEFWHVRIGIENPITRAIDGTKIPGENYVLMKFTSEELVVIQNVYKDVLNELSALVLE